MSLIFSAARHSSFLSPSPNHFDLANVALYIVCVCVWVCELTSNWILNLNCWLFTPNSRPRLGEELFCCTHSIFVTHDDRLGRHQMENCWWEKGMTTEEEKIWKLDSSSRREVNGESCQMLIKNFVSKVAMAHGPPSMMNLLWLLQRLTDDNMEYLMGFVFFYS